MPNPTNLIEYLDAFIADYATAERPEMGFENIDDAYEYERLEEAQAVAHAVKDWLGPLSAYLTEQEIYARKCIGDREENDGIDEMVDDEVGQHLQDVIANITRILGLPYPDVPDEEEELDENVAELVKIPAGFDTEAYGVIVFAEHRRARGEGSTYGPFENAEHARRWAIGKYQSGDFDPDGCEIEYQLPKRP